MNTDALNQLINQIDSHQKPIINMQCQFTSKHAAACVTFQDETILVYATRFSTFEKVMANYDYLDVTYHIADDVTKVATKAFTDYDILNMWLEQNPDAIVKVIEEVNL